MTSRQPAPRARTRKPFPGQRRRVSPSSEGRVAVGRINAAWGIKGHVKVTPYGANPMRFQPGATLLVNGEPRRILDVATPKGFPCVLFEGYEDRTAAESLAGVELEVEEHELQPLPEGEYYVDDLVGLEVVTTGGEPIGTLAEVLRTGANDVYLVRRPEGAEVLIPAIADVVQHVDLDARRVVIEPLPGLLD